MNANLKKVVWTIIGTIAIVTAISALIDSRRGNDAKQALAGTRQELREQGFKIDLADFNVTTDTATRARMTALKIFKEPLQLNASGDYLDLMQTVSNSIVTVIWKQNSLEIGSNNILPWSELQTVLETNREALDAACNAAMSGPIRFDVDRNQDDDDLSGLHHLSEILDDRVILELHEGNPDAAWTNLFAATRLVTAWEPEPFGIAHVLHSFLLDRVFADSWQALQYDKWSDMKLAALQQEWESVNSFTNVPEMAAFERVELVQISHWLSEENPFEGDSFSGFAKEVIQEPKEAYSEIKNGVDTIRYRGYGALTDEKSLLLHLRDDELELRHAIQSQTWAEMRTQPGVTNLVPFKLVSTDLADFAKSYQRTVNLTVYYAAESEARRRILVTAIALERYRGKYGAYPATLAALSPEFLRVVPVDFMDGQPLRYRLTNDGHFVLYSVGLDCVDDGGKMPSSDAPRLPQDSNKFPFAPTNVDIVWPQPEVIGTKKLTGP